MPIKTIEAHRQRDGRLRVIIPAALAGGKRKRKWFSGKGAESRAAQFAASVELSRIAKAQHFEALNLAERSEVGTWVRDLRDAFGHGWMDAGRNAIKDAVAHRQCVRATVSAAILECNQAKKNAGLSAKYRKQIAWSLRQFELRFGAYECNAVTPKEIESWLYAQPWGKAAMRSALVDVRTLFSFALNRHYVSKNPAMLVEKPKVTKKTPCILTPDDAEKLLREAEKSDPGLLPTICLVLFGGLRPEEAIRCRWENITETHIDLPAGETKNNKRRLIELSPLPTLRAWIVRGGDMPATNLKRRMIAVRKAAGVPWGHDILRHSFVSYGVPMWGVTQTALAADHSEKVLADHYRALVTRADAERFWEILPENQQTEKG